MKQIEKIDLLNRVFTPSQPIKQQDLFFGRNIQLRKVVEAINEYGQHAILYGERGVGKTSLANVMLTSFTNIYPVKVTCNRTDNFTSLWKKLFDRVEFSKTIEGIGFTPQQHKIITNIGTSLKNIATLTPTDIENIILKLSNMKFLFIFDEFDNISQENIKEQFADLLKSLSDNVQNVTILLVGIAENIEELIGSHNSLERCIKQIKMPRMSNDEALGIIENGERILEIKIDDDVKNTILELSSGFPHYIHLLCKFGMQEVILNDKSNFSYAYLNIALKKGVENSNEQLRLSYQKATLDCRRESKWLEVLHACALCPGDTFNCFSLQDITVIYNKKTGKSVKGNYISYNIKHLCESDRGNILTKVGKGINTKYRFVNPMMRAFIKMKIQSGK